jgi:hypothetical protein
MGVTVEILKGQKKTLRTAFLALKGGSASAGVPVRAFGKYGSDGFEFSDNGEGKSSALKSISVYWATQNEDVAEIISGDVGPEYAKRFEHELHRLASRLK